MIEKKAPEMDLVLYLVHLTYTPAPQRDPEIDLDLDLGPLSAGGLLQAGAGCLEVGVGVALA